MRFIKEFTISTNPENTKKLYEIIKENFPDEIFFKCDIVKIKINIEIETDLWLRNKEIDEYEQKQKDQDNA